MAELEPVIGVEIHVQLSTRTKMFCGCELSFGDDPNTHTCPVCLAHPGVLPVINAEAVRRAIIIGHALGCEIAPRPQYDSHQYNSRNAIAAIQQPPCNSRHAIAAMQ